MWSSSPPVGLHYLSDIMGGLVIGLDLALGIIAL